MLSLSTAFKVHGVVGTLFCAPVFLMGLKGFIDVMSEGQLTPDRWHMGKLFVIPFSDGDQAQTYAMF